MLCGSVELQFPFGLSYNSSLLSVQEGKYEVKPAQDWAN
jgi:hypothetical protein